MSLTLIGLKEGMTQIFDENGNVRPVTAIRVQPNVVVRVKTKEKDSYSAVQLGSIPQKKNVKKPLKGHFEKNKVPCFRVLKESHVDNPETFSQGQEILVHYFSVGDFVDVAGTSKGKGFQGVMKKYGFRGGPAAHGSGFHRHAGSTGQRTSPGRVFPGVPHASRMGNECVTVMSLQVLKVDPEKELLFVEGAIPGCSGRQVFIRKAIKKVKKK